jgi:uncharacterized membrane protein YhiD involved in acid resistance
MEKLKNTLSTANEVNFIYIIIACLLCVICSYILQIIFKNKSSSFSNRAQLQNLIPILSVTVFLVISVVKSSLALSLGLVGALSIVRFRTPIKEPEELTYIFIAIAIGVGFASGQIILTSTIFFIIIMVILYISSKGSSIKANNYNLIIECDEMDSNFKNISKVMKDNFDNVNFIKYDVLENNKEIYVYNVMIEDTSVIENIKISLSKLLKGLNVNFHDSSIIN